VANTKFRWNIFTTLLVFVIIGGKTKQQIITAGYSVGNCRNHQLEIFFPAPSLYWKSRLSFFLIGYSRLLGYQFICLGLLSPIEKKGFDIIGVKFLPPVKSLVDLLPRPTALNKQNRIKKRQIKI
jgi:hypothetical protein